MRLFFAKIRVDECYGDFSTVKAADDTAAWLGGVFRGQPKDSLAGRKLSVAQEQ